MAKRVYFRKKTKKIIRKIAFLSFLFISLLAISFSFLIIYYLKDLPRPEKFTEGFVSESTKIYDRTGKHLLYEIFGAERRTIVPADKIPDFLKKAVVAAEDKNFYKHRGIDIKAIFRAILYDLKLKKPVQGASTITQQLIRSFFLTRKKTLSRKTREIILSIETERRYSKDQIISWYLNLIPFGSNIYGVEQAAKKFFGKNVSQISLAEAALLAGLIKAPSYYWPYGKHFNELLKRKDYLLERMEKLGFISKKEKESAKREEIKLLPNIEKMLSPHLVFMVKNYLERKYGKEYIKKAGLKVITTLDLDFQKTNEKILQEELEKLKVYNAFNGSILCANPKTGEILSLVGSKDYFGTAFPKNCLAGKNCKFDPKVNTVLSLRQPGSALKPFVYFAAFLKGFTPETIVWDVQTEFNPNCPGNPKSFLEKDRFGQKCYHPKNYDNKFLGPIKLKSALAQSRNVPSVKVLYLVGIKNALKILKKFGITSLKEPKRYGLSLVLGGGEVTLFELVQGYSVFAQEGKKSPLFFIKEIRDQKGNILEKTKKTPLQIFPKNQIRMINKILADNSLRAPMFGRNSLLKIPGYEVAVKTGTTQNFNDAWTIGYTPSLVCGVWVGNNDNSATKKPGVLLAGKIWHKIMKNKLKKLPKENFNPPKISLTGKEILDGILPTKTHSILYFINKEDPLSDKDSKKDPLFKNWEKGIEFWKELNLLNRHQNIKNIFFSNRF